MALCPPRPFCRGFLCSMAIFVAIFGHLFAKITIFGGFYWRSLLSMTAQAWKQRSACGSPKYNWNSSFIEILMIFFVVRGLVSQQSIRYGMIMAYYFKWTRRLMERFYRLMIIRHIPLDFFKKNLTKYYFVHIFIDFSRSWYWKHFSFYLLSKQINSTPDHAVPSYSVDSSSHCDNWNYFDIFQTAPYVIQNTPFMIQREV